jgi:hypothetical protein
MAATRVKVNNMTTTINWVDEIVTLVYVKQVLAEFDQHQLYPHHLPKVKATKNKIAACETALGHKLEPDHVAFLLHADGWDGFMQSSDLFGTPDFCGSDRYLRSQTVLRAYSQDVFTGIGLTRMDFFPIAFSLPDKDLFAMVKMGVSSKSRVFWLADNKEVDRFPSFAEFFLAMIDYNRLSIESVIDIDETYMFPSQAEIV